MAQKILNVSNVNDYARYIGAEELHPLISVIHYDELQHCRHSLNRYEVYGVFLADEQLDELTYGLVQYTMSQHALMCVSPGQIGGKTDTGEEIQTRGRALLFSPELIAGTDLAKRMKHYTYFTYNTTEALLLTETERATLVAILELMRDELRKDADDDHRQPILLSLLSAFLECVARGYSRQLASPTKITDNLLSRFEQLLEHYFDSGSMRSQGLPTVKYCARELYLSPNYFGDLIRERTGLSATQHIRRFVIGRAKQLLAEGLTVTEAADRLGFEYPQHFTRLFKQETGITPSAYLKAN